MKKLYLFLAVALLISAACEKRQSILGKTAPEFRLENVEGGKTALSDFKGKVVLVEFWATWCPPCRMSIPDLVELETKYKDKGLKILAVSVDDSSEDVRKFAKEYNITYTVLMNDGRADKDYSVINIPTTLLIDREGVLKGKHLGYSPGMMGKLSEEIEALL